MSSSAFRPEKIVVVHGGELATDVASKIKSEIVSASPGGLSDGDVTVQCASVRPKKLLDLGASTLVVFVLQTIENSSPTEEGGTTVRFFKRKTHPSGLLEGEGSFRHYAVLGVGDSNLLLDRQTTTARDCNQVAQELDGRLEALGGVRFRELGMADERTGLTEVKLW
eukprot:CAMPEP_0113562908 /NCGR_PEP_ID=MMETSP0015_2-20120614/20775_1 /TAXON_ID=2838 /ORGANISM="Odontella" /LENGTH=166 /DNA_ID=CAMNT_0000464831 /DNA_START=102 /DNA_END=599 /DNA_ORIENTATION=- /assembly_acc=CAM_ASM_000160